KVTDYIRRHSDQPQGFYVRARERLYLGDLSGAESDLREAIRLEPGFSPGWALLAKVHLDRHARTRYAADEAERSARATEASSLRSSPPGTSTAAASARKPETSGAPSRILPGRSRSSPAMRRRSATGASRGGSSGISSRRRSRTSRGPSRSIRWRRPTRTAG